MALERISDMLPDALEIDINGYGNLYNAVLCEHKMPDSEVLPVTYQAIKMYLYYMEEESPIFKYIRSNLGKENLMDELFTLFPEYGLGDLQYQRIIERTYNKS